jgi:hypothetical protein
MFKQEDANKLYDIWFAMVEKYGFEETIGFIDSLKIMYMIRSNQEAAKGGKAVTSIPGTSLTLDKPPRKSLHKGDDER